jgi:signal transduction histidine kinase
MGSPQAGVRRAAIARPALFRTRNALLLGFGGLVLLLIISGLDAIQVLTQMRRSNEAIRREFVLRSKRLEKIRSALYLSGTYVRDYLLEPDPAAAERHRTSLNAIRAQIASELGSYQALLRPEQRGPFDVLKTELDSYWRSLDPVVAWDARKRRADGYAFLRDEVFPRRMNMLGIADRIGAVNEQELTAGEQRVNEMFVRFRNRLLAVFGVTVALGLLQAAATIRLILRLEHQTRQHLDEVTQARAELRELSAKLVKAQEEERKSISRELHDAVGQSLSAVLFELRNLTAVRPQDAAVNDHAGRIRRLVETSIGMLRNIALLLRPSMLDDLGLIPALEWQAREVSRRNGILVNVGADELPDELSDEYKTCIYRVVQEALNNVSKHAGAQSVRITVRVTGGEIALSVQDDGKGFEVGTQKGLGLIGIQERVMNMGGTFRVESQIGRGTLLVAILPMMNSVPKTVPV